MSSVRNSSILIIISSIINIFEFYNIELTLNIENLMLICISISTTIYNYIMFNDLYFEIKNNLNLYSYPNYYPSNRAVNQNILISNSFVFMTSSIIYIYNYWINIDYNNTNINFITIFLMGAFTLFVFVFLMIILYNSIVEIFTFASLLMNHMLFNYTHNLPLLSNIKDIFKNNQSCWVCSKILLKTEYTTQLHCPCNTLFHSKCIERYLILHKNICPNGHRITKFKNEV